MDDNAMPLLMLTIVMLENAWSKKIQSADNLYKKGKLTQLLYSINFSNWDYPKVDWVAG